MGCSWSVWGFSCTVSWSVGAGVRTSGLGRKVMVMKKSASNSGSGQAISLASSRMRRMPVPAFSMKSMRWSRSATSEFRRLLVRPMLERVTPGGSLPGLITSIRFTYTSTKTFAPVKRQSRCRTALVMASRNAFIGYSLMFSRCRPSIRYLVRVLRSMNAMAFSMSATTPPSRSLRSRMCTLSVPCPIRQVMYASGKKRRTFLAKNSTPALRNRNWPSVRSATPMLTSISSVEARPVMRERRNQSSNLAWSKSSGYWKRGQKERSNSRAPSAWKNSRISFRLSFCVIAPCLAKNPSRHCTGLSPPSFTWIANTLPTDSSRTCTGGSHLRAMSMMRARRALESSTPATVPSSRTPSRMIPPRAFAKAVSDLANEEGRLSLNSSMGPSPRSIRAFSSSGVILFSSPPSRSSRLNNLQNFRREFKTLVGGGRLAFPAPGGGAWLNRVMDRAQLADLLTFSRLLAGPVLVALLAGRRLEAAALFLTLAWFTDFFDGRMARSSDRPTRLNGWDLRADAWLAAGLGIGLGLGGYLTWWLVGPLSLFVFAGAVLLTNPAPVMVGIGVLTGLMLLTFVTEGSWWWVPAGALLILFVPARKRFIHTILPALWAGVVSLTTGENPEAATRGRRLTVDEWAPEPDL